MKTIIENLVLCADCVHPAVYDDYTALDYHYTADTADEKMKAIKDGLKNLVPVFVMTRVKSRMNFLADRVTVAALVLQVQEIIL